MKNGEKPTANPFVMLREEFDDWAILFNPDTGRGFGLSLTGVYLWKRLDGEHTIEALLKEIYAQAEDVPGEAGDHIGVFIDQLVTEGLAGYDVNRVERAAPCPKECSASPSEQLSEAKRLTYEPPHLVDFKGEGKQAVGYCANTGSQNASGCSPTGHLAHCCNSGTGDGYGGCCDGACNTPCGCGGCASVSYCVAGSNDTTCTCQYGSYATGVSCVGNGIYAGSCSYTGVHA